MKFLLFAAAFAIVSAVLVAFLGPVKTITASDPCILPLKQYAERNKLDWHLDISESGEFYCACLGKKFDTQCGCGKTVAGAISETIDHWTNKPGPKRIAEGKAANE